MEEFVYSDNFLSSLFEQKNEVGDDAKWGTNQMYPKYIRFANILLYSHSFCVKLIKPKHFAFL